MESDALTLAKKRCIRKDGRPVFYILLLQLKISDKFIALYGTDSKDLIPLMKTLKRRWHNARNIYAYTSNVLLLDVETNNKSFEGRGHAPTGCATTPLILLKAKRLSAVFLNDVNMVQRISVIQDKYFYNVISIINPFPFLGDPWVSRVTNFILTIKSSIRHYSPAAYPRQKVITVIGWNSVDNQSVHAHTDTGRNS